MTHNEQEIERWIAETQSATDTLCIGLRDIVRTDAPADVMRDAVASIVALHQMATIEASMRLFAGIGITAPTVPVASNDP